MILNKFLNVVYKKHDNALVIAIKTFILMLGFFFAAIVFATAIPNSWVSKNADRSIAILRNEGNTSFSYSSQKNDGFSDKIMFSMAESNSKRSMNVVAAAMDSSYISYANPDQPQIRSYERFWHGYVVLLKPLLLFFDITMIRQLVILSFVLMVAVVAYYIAKIVSGYVALAFVTALAIFNPPVVMVNLEYFTTFAVMLVGSGALLYLLQKNVSQKYITSLFLVIGGSTIFFDFLTTPIITWGMPLTIYAAYILIHQKKNAGRLWLRAMLVSFAWLAGYVLIWASKWALASVILHRNIIQNALETTNYYTSAEGARGGVSTLAYSLDDMYELNIEYAALFWPILKATIIVSLGLAIALMVRKKFTSKLISGLSLLIGVTLAPFVWMFFARSHSYIHHWMTNRDLMIASFSSMTLASILWLIVREKHKTKKRV